MEAGQKIYMHCWGGRGRAGTLGACLLGDLYGIGADDALLRVQKAFDTRGDAGLPLSILGWVLPRCHCLKATLRLCFWKHGVQIRFDYGF